MSTIALDRTARFPAMAPWTRASTPCSLGPTPGASALLAYWLESFPGVARSLGIFNCRPVRGSTALSKHGKGLAADLAVPVTDAGHAVGYAFLRRLGPHAADLGIEYVVFDRRQWSNRRRPEGEPYGGVHPHLDHLHVELSPRSGQFLTLATLRARAGDFRATLDQPSAQPPTTIDPATPSELVDEMKLLDLSKVGAASSTWVDGDAVKVLQAGLLADGEDAGGLVDGAGRPDGRGGPATRNALGRSQRRHKTGVPSSPATPDFVAGPGTYRALFVKK